MDNVQETAREREPGQEAGAEREKEAGQEKPQEKLEIPSIELLRAELERVEANRNFRKILLNVAGILAVAAAVTALTATRLLVLLQVNGSSMSPAYEDGEILVLRQTKEIQKGEVIGFYYGGKILLKRAIGSEGDMIDIDQEGNVSVNGERIEEPYVEEKKLGKCELEFPYRVPEGMTFVLGDNRAVSIDSRVRSLGCVEGGQVIGKVVFRVWPLARIGIMH